MTYITVSEFLTRSGDHVPRDANGDPDTTRIEAAIEDAAGVIRAYLPELLADDDTPIAPPARLEGVLRSISLDLALFSIFDTTTGGEDVLSKRHAAALRMLSELGGGMDPHQADEVQASIVEGSASWIRGEEPEV